MRYGQIARATGFPKKSVEMTMYHLQKRLGKRTLFQLGRWSVRAGLALALAALVHAQTPVTTTVPPTPGNIVQTSVITATAPAGAAVAGQIICTLANSATSTLTVTGSCVQGTSVWSYTIPAPPVGPNGAMGSVTSLGNSITWNIQQLTAGVISWQVVANDVLASGTL